ncbi:unnamed protein product, partial [Chrysoparadoxa australica]
RYSSLQSIGHGAFGESSSIVLVLEYMCTDLSVLMDEGRGPMPESHCKSFSWMLLQGLEHMHQLGLLHRDIKPSNLLISSEGVLKIADLGLARVYHSKGQQTRSYRQGFAPGTRWYRAPELLFGSRRYGSGVDVWAAGVVIADMIGNQPTFPGNSEIDQLFKVMGVMGSVNEDTWPGCTKLPDYGKIVFPAFEPQPWSQVSTRGREKQGNQLTQSDG